MCTCFPQNQEPEVGLEGGGTYAILPRQSSEELTQLPSLLTSKVLELKEGLNCLCTASGTSQNNTFVFCCPPILGDVITDVNGR